jgi:glutamyl-tRNA reductase
MNLVCFGLSHHTASIEVREQFAVGDAALPRQLERLKQVPGVDEGLIVSTCNRTEFYVVGRAGTAPAPAFFGDFFTKPMSGEENHLFRLFGGEVARHLFRVASGLDSMVVGETEIFGQVKKAYETALANGLTGKLLNRLFQKAFQVGKQVRSSTAITRGSVSVGSVAVDLAEQIFGRLTGCKVMVLGAGETSEKTARALHARGARQIFVSNRSYDRAAALAEAMGGRAIRFEEWEKEFSDLDILVSSTSAPHAVVTAEKLAPHLRGRRDRPLFMIDLAVPRDIEPAVNNLDDVYVYDLDSLQAMADRTLESRRTEAAKCEILIERHVSEFELWCERSLIAAPADWAVELRQ